MNYYNALFLSIIFSLMNMASFADSLCMGLTASTKTGAATVADSYQNYWYVDFPNATGGTFQVRGFATCARTSAGGSSGWGYATNIYMGTASVSDGKYYCWCKMFLPLESYFISSNWTSNNIHTCHRDCAKDCATLMANHYEYFFNNLIPGQIQ